MPGVCEGTRLNAATGVFLVVIAALAANLPFFSRRIFLAIKPASSAKGIAWCLAELVVLYFAVGGIALALEARSGQVYPQNWEFYAMTGCMFLVLAYPGFVWRYLWKRQG